MNKSGPEATVLAVVMPLLNEELILMSAAENLATELDRIVGRNRWALLPVDNGSTDQTPQVIEGICRRWPLTRPIRLAKPNIGVAIRTGLMATHEPWALILPIDELDVVFLRWAWQARDHYDMILGSKRVDPAFNHQSSYRYVLSWGLNSLINLGTGYMGSDTHGQKLVRMESIRPVVGRCVMSRGQFDTELTIRSSRAGLRLAEVPVVYIEKRPPRNLMLTKIARNVRDMVRLWRVLKSEPFNGPTRLHRWSRPDLEENVLPAVGPERAPSLSHLNERATSGIPLKDKTLLV